MYESWPVQPRKGAGSFNWLKLVPFLVILLLLVGVAAQFVQGAGSKVASMLPAAAVIVLVAGLGGLLPYYFKNKATASAGRFEQAVTIGGDFLVIPPKPGKQAVESPVQIQLSQASISFSRALAAKGVFYGTLVRISNRTGDDSITILSNREIDSRLYDAEDVQNLWDYDYYMKPEPFDSFVATLAKVPKRSESVEPVERGSGESPSPAQGGELQVYPATRMWLASDVVKLIIVANLGIFGLAILAWIVESLGFKDAGAWFAAIFVPIFFIGMTLLWVKRGSKNHDIEIGGCRLRFVSSTKKATDVMDLRLAAAKRFNWIARSRWGPAIKVGPCLEISRPGAKSLTIGLSNKSRMWRENVGVKTDVRYSLQDKAWDALLKELDRCNVEIK